MRTTANLKRLAVYLSIIAVAAITYLPVVDNFFISDDFAMVSFVHILRQAPVAVLEAPSEFFRLTSYLYFSACLWMFGLNPVPFYWTGIALHALVSLLVYTLVFMTTRQRVAAWAAAIFFAGYERHQEAVMWISAVNETLVTLFCLLFLILWLRSAGWSRKLALIALVAALFSKEQAVTLAPLAIVLSVWNGKAWRTALRESTPVLVITAAYICLWLAYSGRNAFVTNHYYAVTLHFFPVYARSLMRLLSVAALFAAVVFVVRRHSVRDLWSRDRMLILFFAAIVALALIPPSFLLYQNHVPSRNTYYPSVGLSAIVGMLFAWCRDLSSRKAQYLAVFFLSTFIACNVAYVWLKKEPQYLGRAAPTRRLIYILNNVAPRLGNEKTVCIERFPLDPSIGSEAARWFTSVPPPNIIFSSSCEFSAHAVVVHWIDTDGGPTTIEDSDGAVSLQSKPGI